MTAKKRTDRKAANVPAHKEFTVAEIGRLFGTEVWAIEDCPDPAIPQTIEMCEYPRRRVRDILRRSSEKA